MIANQRVTVWLTTPNEFVQADLENIRDFDNGIEVRNGSRLLPAVVDSRASSQHFGKAHFNGSVVLPIFDRLVGMPIAKFERLWRQAMLGL